MADRTAVRNGLLATIAVLLTAAGLRESYSVSMPLAVCCDNDRRDLAGQDIPGSVFALDHQLHATALTLIVAGFARHPNPDSLNEYGVLLIGVYGLFSSAFFFGIG